MRNIIFKCNNMGIGLQWTGYVVDFVQKIFGKKPKDLDYYK